MLTSQPPRPLCQHCKVSLAKPNGKSKHGFTKWHKYCSECSKVAYDSKYSHLQHKKSICERCGFVPENMCQLDVVYKDGNRKNKDKENLKTLCANCNRVYKKKENKKSILDITVDTDYRL